MTATSVIAAAGRVHRAGKRDRRPGWLMEDRFRCPLRVAPILGLVGAVNVPAWARELLEQARVACLGFLDGEGRPSVLPVTFAVAEGAVWSAIDDKPKRTR